MERFLLRKKNAVITGATSGIGKAVAELFVKLGANVLITGRNVENLHETKRLCELNTVDDNQKIIIFESDLSEDIGVTRLGEKALSVFPIVDILVNNAGILCSDNIENVDLNIFDQIMKINVRAMIQLTHLLTNSLIEAKGTVVNVSSVAGTKSFTNLMTYCISKAAVEQFTKCSALDLAAKGVRVNSICPGVIITEIHKRAGMDEDKYTQFLEKAKSTHAMGRTGDVMEVAYSIAFLASSACSFTTAASFPIDGGRHAMCPR